MEAALRFGEPRLCQSYACTANLYIADIFDTSANGKTAKQFGRIFYTRDRSLIFYGFDLDDQAICKQDVSFQVRGSGSYRTKPVSLACFTTRTVTNEGRR